MCELVTNCDWQLFDAIVTYVCGGWLAVDQWLAVIVEVICLFDK